ncbi:XK-related protein 7 [Frankliniella occidentalis]|uniref:XK-related protein n=1 Tax=Frankliniella occidentalis TaxID=133901 RepID=A0A6J1SPK1_FRAOC|nr:XK-related protein 7 [Frankliniella occidentalis]
MASSDVGKVSSASLGAKIDEIGVRHSEENGKMASSLKFGFYYITCHLLSIVTYLVDHSFSCWLAYQYHVQEQETYFALTVTFIVLPALISTGISMRWYIQDVDDPTLPKAPLWRWVLRVFFLLAQFAPILRYLDSLYYGIRSIIASRKNEKEKQQYLYRRMVDEDSDASLLRLFHCFLHAAPQAILHLMILIRMAKQRQPLQAYQGWAVVCALISIAWALTSYHRSVRFARDDKEKLSWKGSTIQFCWHLMGTASRVLALAMLAAMYPAWMGTVCLCHWCVMAAWLALGHHQTAVCSSRCEELMFSGVLGLAYILAFIAPRDGPTRYTYLAYYLVCFMENTGALVVWCVGSSSVQNPSLYYGTVTMQVLTFLLGILFMLLYYRYFHPSGTSTTIRKSITITEVSDRLSKAGASGRAFSHTL